MRMNITIALSIISDVHLHSHLKKLLEIILLLNMISKQCEDTSETERTSHHVKRVSTISRSLRIRNWSFCSTNCYIFVQFV